MLYLSGFELYSRWVPLFHAIADSVEVSGCLTETSKLIRASILNAIRCRDCFHISHSNNSIFCTHHIADTVIDFLIVVGNFRVVI